MIRFLLLLALLPSALLAQNDSTLLLEPERLTVKDILPRDLIRQKTMAVSATRSLEAVEDLPFTTVVFTAEDILRNGFVTLADVLKAAPGIRVSQPGNAIEGETWMLRGFSGNQYMKILINDVPLKPSVAPGMPIGAQLPIRQAERIEIVYTPAGAVYGDETCAGVVNIILKESERPVYTQADLSFGRFGYNSLDLMFGGKIGKDKKIFRFSMYGSSTVRDRTDVYYDESIYNTNRYLPFGLNDGVYRRVQNFRPANPGDSIPRLSQIPHESRLFGINLTWRGLHFTYHRMLRFDHTSLGLNPLAVGYANSSNRIAERIETFSIGFQRKRNRRTTHNNLSVQRYSIDNNSSYSLIFDRVSAANYYLRQGPSLPDSSRANLLREIYNFYASEDRFATANGIDVRLETRSNVLIGSKKRLQFEGGAQINVGLGVPLMQYNTIPLEVQIDGTTTPNFPQPVNTYLNTEGAFNLVAFSQLAWRGKKLKVVGGSSISVRIFEGIALAPRVGALYRLDSSWTFRANISTGIRHMSLFGSFQTYEITAQEGFLLNPKNPDPLTEMNYAGELAVRYTTKGGSNIEGIFFRQDAYNLYRPGFIQYSFDTPPRTYYGYQNAPGLSMSLWGIQALLSGAENTSTITWSKKDIPLKSRLQFYIQYARGKEWFGEGYQSTDEVRNQPKWHTQFRYYFKAGKKFEMVVAANQLSSTLGKAVIFEELFQLEARPRLKKYSTWDFMTRFYLSNHFLVYFQFINVFDRHHAGLDASGTTDDLLYNPQQGRVWKIGVNYNMN
ncbi:MAG TPA: TonB-dependent receptor [Saprospiraceae bacterium]|nr:TonB-dependent receptor [Saprospiraceae bacterium]